MNIIKALILAAAMICGNATTLWAADSVRKDNSNIFVWIFLAFCALIVLAQLIPAVMLIMGFAKGAKKEVLKPAPVTVEQKAAPDA